MRALEKAGLVELEQGGATTPAPEAATEPTFETAMDPSRSGDSIRASGPVASGDAKAPTATRVDSGPIHEQRPFDEIYQMAQVAPSPFPAEKLLKIMEGLAVLEPAARKAAVLALDAADDAWTIDDALLDAERKLRALDGAKQQIEEQARAALAHAQREIEAREQRQQEVVAQVRQQIAELESLLERETTRATEDKAALQEGARAATHACERESTRYDTEAAHRRLGIRPPDAADLTDRKRRRAQRGRSGARSGLRNRRHVSASSSTTRSAQEALTPREP